jgi:hypothetical protein
MLGFTTYNIVTLILQLESFHEARGRNHYRRRFHQSSFVTFRDRKHVDSLHCDVPIDSDTELIRGKRAKQLATKGIRFDTLLIHYMKNRKDAFLFEGKSLLNIGFNVTSAVEAATILMKNCKITNEETFFRGGFRY